jgi:selenium-binding protein 1
VGEITPAELAAKAGYSRPHTIHCGPGGIFVFSLGGADGDDGPGGVALVDHDSVAVVGAWEADRGGSGSAMTAGGTWATDTMVTSEWPPPR